MAFHGRLAHNFSPEVSEVLERAFDDVWTVLAAHQEPGSECEPEMGITVGRTLVALATNGITDRQELRRQALETIALAPRQPRLRPDAFLTMNGGSLFTASEGAKPEITRQRRVEEAIMAESVGLSIELEGSDLIVTMPGTIFMVAYCTRDDVPELTASFVQDDEDGPISRVEFLARSRRLANAKARELGWIA